MADLPDVLEVFIADMAGYIGPMRDARDVTIEFAAAVAEAKAALSELDGTSVDISAHVKGISGPIAGAIAQVNALKSAMNGLGDASVTVGAEIRGAGGAALFAGTRFGGWIAAMGGVAGVLSAVHLGLVLFSAQVIADTIGIVAFGLAAANAIGPAVQAVGHLTTAYAGLDRFQKGAALALQSFMDSLRNFNQAGIFGVFYQALALVQQAMSHTGPIVSQATKAFSDFAGMLAADFSSPAWAAVIGKGATLIRTDLDALFRLINAGINLIPVLFHNFNSLGLAVINAAGAFIRGATAVLGWNRALTDVVALGTAAWAFWKLFGGWITATLVPALRSAAITVTAFFANLAAGEGLTGAIALMTGLSAATVAAGLALGGLGLAFGALLIVAGHTTNAIHQQIEAWKLADNAAGNNAAGYEKLASQIASNTSTLQHSVQANRDYGNSLVITGIQLQGLRQQFEQTATNITTNTRNLGNALNLSDKQVVAFANKTGVDLTHALRIGSAAFIQAEQKIKGFSQAVFLSHHPLSQFQVDVNQSRSAANTLTQQVSALQAAFQALITPTLNVIQGAVNFKQSEIALAGALRASNGVVGTHNALQRTAATDLVNAANAALTQSANLKNMTGSTRAAAAPLNSLIKLVEGLHLRGLLAAQVLRELKAAEDALYNKTITITVNTVQSGGGITQIRSPGQVGTNTPISQQSVISAPQIVNHFHISGVVTDGAMVELGHQVVRALGRRTLRNGSNQLFIPSRAH